MGMEYRVPMCGESAPDADLQVNNWNNQQNQLDDDINKQVLFPTAQHMLG
jgi:hypothetical protein